MTQPIRRPRRLLPVLTLGLALAWLPAGGPPAPAQQPPAAASETAGGLHTARFATVQGTVTVYLPDDLAAGDTLSGTVSYSPSGKTETEREKSLGTLRGYVVEVAGQPVPEGSGWQARIPDAAGPLIVRLRGASGRPTEVPIPVAPTPATSPAEFGIPAHGQAGRSLSIPGPFGGGTAGPRIEIGGREAPVLAQSPRQTVVLVPEDLAGPSTLRIEQGDSTAEGTVRILAVQLSADRIHLQRGERTTLHVEVRGLEGLAEPIPLHLTNQSPTVVQLEDGDSQTVTIEPSDVPSSGVLRLDRSVQSRRTGDFSITTNLARPRYASIPPQPVPIGAPPPEPCECESVTLAPDRDPKKAKAIFDAATKKLTVTFAYTAEMFCHGDRGDCTGRLQIASASGTGWWQRGPDPNVPGGFQWDADKSREFIRGEAVSPAAGTNGNFREITARCRTGRGATFREKDKKADYVFDLSGLRAGLDAVRGRITFELKTECNGKEVTRTAVLQVDTTVPAGDGQPQGLDPALSDFDGDGKLDHCACRAPRITLDAAKATAGLDKLGARHLLTLAIPYSAEIACEHPQGKEGDPCTGRFTVSASTPTLTWLVPAGRQPPQTILALGAPATLTPAEITCSGTCKSPPKPVPQPGTLTYRVGLLDTGSTKLSGSLEITVDPANTCGDSAKRTFKVELDTSKKQGEQVEISETGE
jgi:hypothetical protein